MYVITYDLYKYMICTSIYTYHISVTVSHVADKTTSQGLEDLCSYILWRLDIDVSPGKQFATDQEVEVKAQRRSDIPMASMIHFMFNHVWVQRMRFWHMISWILLQMMVFSKAGVNAKRLYLGKNTLSSEYGKLQYGICIKRVDWWGFPTFYPG